MKESRWLASTDIKALLLGLPESVSQRKRMLLACALCRRVWDALTDERSRRGVEAAERSADGEKPQDFESIWRAASDAHSEAAQRFRETTDPQKRNAAAIQSGAAGAVGLSIWGVENWTEFNSPAALFGVAANSTRETASTSPEFGQAERAAQVALVRCVLGNPFRPQAAAPAWLTWHDGMIPRLAREIYELRAFDHLPILADALEEAGCMDRELLEHCRLPGSHARGCWVVDLILGKK
jgi:hypothetical protein